MGNTNTLHTRLVEYYIGGTSAEDVARKLKLEYQYVSSFFASWDLDKKKQKKDIEVIKAAANEPVFSLLPEYNIFKSREPISDFALETQDHEVLRAYYRMINPPKNKAA